MGDLSLHFAGPFTFSSGPQSLFHSEFANAEGIYLWTVQQAQDSSHLICYVGETTNFGKRHREHLIHILSMNYGVFDLDAAMHGQHVVLWGGLWRAKNIDGPDQLLSKFGDLVDRVRRNINITTIFFAPTQLESRLRKHVEGCIGWNLRNKHPEYKVLYPDDNHIGTGKRKDNGILRITADANIRGLDASIPY